MKESAAIKEVIFLIFMSHDPRHIIQVYLHGCKVLTFLDIPTVFYNFWLNLEVPYLCQNARINIVSFEVVFKRQALFEESKRTPAVGIHIGLSGL
jgi:hypothetical protein